MAGGMGMMGPGGMVMMPGMVAPGMMGELVQGSDGQGGLNGR